MLDVHIARGAALTVAAIEVPVGGVAPLRRPGGGRGQPRHRASRRSRRRPRPRPGTPASAWAPWASTSSTPTSLVRELQRDAEEHEQPRLRQGHHPPARGGGRARLRLPLLGREQEGVEVLARRGHARRLLRGVHGPHPGRSRLQPLRPRLAAAHLPAAVPARQVRLRRGRPARHARPTPSSPMGCIVSGSEVRRSDPLPGGARPLVLRRPGLDPHAQRHRPPPLAASGAPSSTATWRSRAGAIIGYDPAEDRRRHTVSEGGVVVVTPGEECLVDPAPPAYEPVRGPVVAIGAVR